MRRLLPWWCRVFGHACVFDDGGAPIVPPLWVCVRCGHFERAS